MAEVENYEQYLSNEAYIDAKIKQKSSWTSRLLVTTYGYSKIPNLGFFLFSVIEMGRGGQQSMKCFVLILNFLWFL